MVLLLLLPYCNQYARIDDWMVKQRTGKRHRCGSVRDANESSYCIIIIIIIARNQYATTDGVASSFVLRRYGLVRLVMKNLIEVFLLVLLLTGR